MISPVDQQSLAAKRSIPCKADRTGRGATELPGIGIDHWL